MRIFNLKCKPLRNFGLFSGNLKTKCAVPLNKEQFKWIKEKSPGQNGVNIIINDFVNLDNSKFAREIIDLNLKHFK